MISADIKSNVKQQEIKDLVTAFCKLYIVRSTFKTSNTMSYFIKKEKYGGRVGGGGVEDILF